MPLSQRLEDQQLVTLLTAPSEDVDMEDASVDKRGWPVWLMDAYKSLLGEGRPEGALWTTTLNDWTELERYYSFKNPSGSVRL